MTAISPTKVLKFDKLPFDQKTTTLWSLKHVRVGIRLQDREHNQSHSSSDILKVVTYNQRCILLFIEVGHLKNIGHIKTTI